MAEPNQHSAPRGAIAALLLGVALIGCNSLLLGPVLADVARDLGTTPRHVSDAIGAYNGATAITALLLAPRLDRLGLARALRVGLLCLCAALILCAAAPGVPALLAGQALAGIGAGLALPATYGLAVALSPPAAQGQALGRVLTGWSVALVAGVPACALLTQLAGWRAAFALIALLAALALARARALAAPATRPGVRPRLRAVLALPGVLPLFGVCLAYMAAFYGTYAFLPSHVRTLHGVAAGGAGLIALAYGIGFGAASAADGLLDRLGAGRVLAASLLFIAVVYAGMPAAARAWPALLGLATGWGFANHLGLNALILQLGRANPEARGAVLGMNSAVTYLGATLGVAGAGALQAGFAFPAVAYAASAVMAAAALLATAAAYSHSSARYASSTLRSL